MVDYDDAVIRAALERLGRNRWTRLASGPGSRAPKYRHLLDEALGLGDEELSILAVLMLRGPQTTGELNQRSERLHRFAGIDAVESTLERLAGRNLVARLARRPGQKEERWIQRLGEETEEAVEPEAVEPDAALADAERPDPPPAELEARVRRLEQEVRTLREAVEALRPSPGGGVE